MKMDDELLILIADRLKAMSEPTRLRILNLLKENEMSVSEIAEAAELKHGTASANLNTLHRAGLVSSRREGTKMLYCISSDMVFRICDVVCDSLKEEFKELQRLRKAIS